MSLDLRQLQHEQERELHPDGYVSDEAIQRLQEAAGAMSEARDSMGRRPPRQRFVARLAKPIYRLDREPLVPTPIPGPQMREPDADEWRPLLVGLPTDK